MQPLITSYNVIVGGGELTRPCYVTSHSMVTNVLLHVAYMLTEMHHKTIATLSDMKGW